MVIIPLLERHQGSWDRGLWLPKNEPKEESEGEPDELTTNLPGLVCASLYTLLHLCKQNDSDIIMMSWSSASSFRWEKSLYMCSRVMLTCLWICWHPQPISLYQPCTNCYVNSVSWFLHLWYAPPGILLCPHTGACSLLKTQCNKNECKNRKKCMIRWMIMAVKQTQAVVRHPTLQKHLC